MVMWIWIGTIIVLLGGLIAIFPAPSVMIRRVSVRLPAPQRTRRRDRLPA
jgi:hypothetical protein